MSKKKEEEFTIEDTGSFLLFLFFIALIVWFGFSYVGRGNDIEEMQTEINRIASVVAKEHGGDKYDILYRGELTSNFYRHLTTEERLGKLEKDKGMLEEYLGIGIIEKTTKTEERKYATKEEITKAKECEGEIANTWGRCVVTIDERGIECEPKVED